MLRTDFEHAQTTVCQIPICRERECILSQSSLPGFVKLASMLGAPAARLADNHVCPAGGGPILPGCSPNVRFNSLPAARATDIVADPYNIDVIVQGATTVRINGKFAARIGDRTAAGGTIVSGSPNVRIGIPASAQCLKNAAKNGIPFIRGVAV